MHEKFSKNIKLVCPSCRKMTPDGLVVSPLELVDIIQKNGEYILYGFFQCEDPKCKIKYPIIEGVPCIINPTEQHWWSEIMSSIDTLKPPEQIKQYILKLQTDKPTSKNPENQAAGLHSYNEESLIGCYMDNNYDEFVSNYNPPYQWADYRPYWKTVIELSRPNGEKRYGRTIELGCSVGRYTFELAHTSELAIGLDFKFRPVFEAAKIQRQGCVKFNKKIRGAKFEEVRTNFEPPDNTIFIVANALDPPFLQESFDLVAGLNLLDNIKQPRILLGQMNALLRSGGILILGSPFEWRLDICEPTEWLETEMKDAVETVRGILGGKVLPEYGLNFVIESEEDIIWPLRNHDRYWSIFRSNLIKAKKG